MKSLGDQGNGAETQWPYTIKNTVLTKIVLKSKKKKKESLSSSGSGKYLTPELPDCNSQNSQFLI